MKRCVALDCYRQSLFLNTLSLGQILKEIGSIGGVTGIDASTECFLDSYPGVSDSFCGLWRDLLAENGLRPITMGTYIDRLQFRDHVMTVRETADAICRDLRITKRLGFENMRLMHDLPLEAVELALPLAEELNIRLLDELLAPATILPSPGRKGEDCARLLELVHRTGTKHLGLLINLGLFQTQPNPSQMLDALLPTMDETQAEQVYQEVMARSRVMEFPAFESWVMDTYPQLTTNRELFQRMFGVRIFGHSVSLDDLDGIGSYVYDVYAKFQKMYPKDSGWVEPSIPYDAVVRKLEAVGYEGCLSSMRLGAPGISLGQNRTAEEITREETEDVRRHQQMLKTLIG